MKWPDKLCLLIASCRSKAAVEETMRQRVLFKYQYFHYCRVDMYLTTNVRRENFAVCALRVNESRVVIRGREIREYNSLPLPSLSGSLQLCISQQVVHIDTRLKDYTFRTLNDWKCGFVIRGPAPESSLVNSMPPPSLFMAD